MKRNIVRAMHVNNFFTNLVKLVWSVTWWGKRWCLDLVPVRPVSGVDGAQVAAISLTKEMVAYFFVFPNYYQYYSNSEISLFSLAEEGSGKIFLKYRVDFEYIFNKKKPE